MKAIAELEQTIIDHGANDSVFNTFAPPNFAEHVTPTSQRNMLLQEKLDTTDPLYEPIESTVKTLNARIIKRAAQGHSRLTLKAGWFRHASLIHADEPAEGETLATQHYHTDRVIVPGRAELGGIGVITAVKVPTRLVFYPGGKSRLLRVIQEEQAMGIYDNVDCWAKLPSKDQVLLR